MKHWTDMERGFTGEGNFLGSHRRNFSVPNRTFNQIHELSLELGVNHSVILVLAIRKYYKKIIGEAKPIKYSDGRIAK
jgi:hypothetical protein